MAMTDAIASQNHSSFDGDGPPLQILREAVASTTPSPMAFTTMNVCSMLSVSPPPIYDPLLGICE